MGISTWRQLIEEEMRRHGETFEDVVSCTLSEEELDEKFNDGFGTEEGVPFSLWTHKRVYFPVVYDGSEWTTSVSRHPDERPQGHVGGG